MIKLICASAFLLLMAYRIVEFYKQCYQYIKTHKREISKKKWIGIGFSCVLAFAFYCLVVSLFI